MPCCPIVLYCRTTDYIIDHDASLASSPACRAVCRGGRAGNAATECELGKWEVRRGRTGTEKAARGAGNGAQEPGEFRAINRSFMRRVCQGDIPMGGTGKLNRCERAGYDRRDVPLRAGLSGRTPPIRQIRFFFSAARGRMPIAHVAGKDLEHSSTNADRPLDKKPAGLEPENKQCRLFNPCSGRCKFSNCSMNTRPS